MRAAWVIVLGASVALGCATPTPAPTESTPPRIMVSEAGGQVALAVRQELGLQLQANVTTGYGWAVVPPLPEVLTAIDPGTYHASTDSDASVGAGGTTSFVFLAVRPGKGVLQLAYRRPWERDVIPARTVRVDVEVR
ncbi:MAG TPA: protease inhibitor I42 family protein [Myxococcaceae bacterium]|jgi:inhibitor of cysteine peptidase